VPREGRRFQRSGFAGRPLAYGAGVAGVSGEERFVLPVMPECRQRIVQQQQQVQPKQVSMARQGWPKTDARMRSHHKFQVRETVTLIRSISRNVAGGIYQVVRQPPKMGSTSNRTSKVQTNSTSAFGERKLESVGTHPPGGSRRVVMWERALACSACGDGGRKPMRVRFATAKIFGWLIYTAGFAIWLYGYLSAGHAPVFDWNAATAGRISGFVPNLEAELGMALMFASMIPIYGRAVRGNLAPLFACVAVLVLGFVTLVWWGFLAWLIWHAI
jgi:hypothetical protein